jgi:hypothetical protein
VCSDAAILGDAHHLLGIAIAGSTVHRDDQRADALEGCEHRG